MRETLSSTTLANICQGGIYDHLGGGFARYSVDERWLVPHFEKMLYDNALLIDLLMRGLPRDAASRCSRRRIAETVGWLLREMIAEGGGFAASLDADSEGEEGKFYVWSAAEIAEVLGEEDAAVFARAYDVTDAGNWEGHTILNRLAPLAAVTPTRKALADMRAKLLARRGGARPSRLGRQGAGRLERPDDRRALARGAVVFERPDGLALAERAFACVDDEALGRGRPPLPFLSRGPGQGAGDRQRLRQHDLGALRLYRGNRIGRLSRRRPCGGRTSSTSIIGTTPAADTSRPPMIPTTLSFG